MRFAAAAMLILGALTLPAQTTSFLTLHTFTARADFPSSSSDGGYPAAGVALSGNTLYGTTTNGGSGGFGTVFAVHTDGSGFAILYSFTNGTDGAAPKAPLLPAGGVLYGTATGGGAAGWGTVFMLNTTGSEFTTLYTFTNGSDGAGPAAGLALSGANLYGTTPGSYYGPEYGTIFSVNTNGSNFSVLHTFTYSGGAVPSGPLIVAGTTLYGAAYEGGTNGTGALFATPASGPGFASFYNFAAGSGFSFPPTNAGGANPLGGLVLSGGTLYGAADIGGSDGYGTVYKVNPDGSGFTPLHAFNIVSDNENPTGPLIVASNLVYGVTPGTIFAVTTNGTGFTNLFTFPPTVSNGKFFTNATGYSLNGGLVLAGQSFYGTAQTGGDGGAGTVFAFNLFPAAIPLTIEAMAGAVVISWSNAVFSLQAAPAVAGPYTNLSGATSPYTNALTGPPMFFRLLAN